MKYCYNITITVMKYCYNTVTVMKYCYNITVTVMKYYTVTILLLHVISTEVLLHILLLL